MQSSRQVRVVLFDCEADHSLQPLLNYRSIALLRLVNRPLIFHIFEKLVRMGIKECDLVLHHFPEQVERITAGDSRWGLRLTHHLARDFDHIFSTILPALKRSEDELFLFGTLNSLPDFSDEVWNTSPSCFFDFPHRGWSGWCLLDRSALEKIDAQTPYTKLPHLPMERKSLPLKPLFTIQNAQDFKETNNQALSARKHPFLFPTESKEVEEGVWISRSVIIEPGVKVIPPVFIGENSQIFSGVTLGPDALIESDCMIDNNATITNGLICRHSYVGESVEISDGIVDRNVLINLTHDTCLSISEEFILSDSTPPKLSHPISRFFQRLIALFLWIVLLPIYVFLRFSYPIHKAQKVKLPFSKDGKNYTTYELYSFRKLVYFSWLPTLLNVLRGDLALVGTAPRSIEEIERLPQDWKNLYAKAKAGMITLADLENIHQKAEDELYATEAYYAVHSGFFYDCKLFLRWLVRIITRDCVQISLFDRF